MIYTIGYAGTNLERFVDILKSKNVDFLIDVRSIPKSQYFCQFNDTNLNKILSNANIKYENRKYEFGARQDNLDFYTNDILDYKKFAESEQFKNGLAKVQDLVNQNKTICLMCAEIDPVNCHRAILCGKEMAKFGLEVTHIIAKRNGETYFETQSEFETRLLQLAKVNNLDEAYCKQNKKIGYKLTK